MAVRQPPGRLRTDILKRTLPKTLHRIYGFLIVDKTQGYDGLITLVQVELVRSCPRLPGFDRRDRVQSPGYVGKSITPRERWTAHFLVQHSISLSFFSVKGQPQRFAISAATALVSICETHSDIFHLIPWNIPWGNCHRPPDPLICVTAPRGRMPQLIS